MMEPPLSIKSQVLQFIKEKQRTTRDITTKFGNSGSIWTYLNQLENDGLINKPKRGIWKKYITPKSNKHLQK